MNKRWTFDLLVYDLFLTLWSTNDFLSLKNLFSNLKDISLEEFKVLITNLIENNILIMRDII